MNCIQSSHTVERTIKKSRFIGVIIPCSNETELIQALNGLQAEHPGANHIAFAFRLLTPKGVISRFHDAGEPSGTAGKPIFQHLEGRDLINCLVAVVRYFGGVKLGAGGLTRAYGNSAREVIEAGKITPFIEYQSLRLTIHYDQQRMFEYQLKKLNGSIIDQSYGEHVELTIRLPKKDVAKLVERFGG